MTESIPSVFEKIISDVTIISVGIIIRSIETFSRYYYTSSTIIPLHIFPEQIISWNNNQRFVRLIGVIKPQILVLLKKYTNVLPVLIVITQCIYHPLSISTLIPKNAQELDVWIVFFNPYRVGNHYPKRYFLTVITGLWVLFHSESGVMVFCVELIFFQKYLLK